MMRDLLIEAAHDIEQAVRHEYGYPDVHPAMHWKYDRDMEIVSRLRAAADSLESPPRPEPVAWAKRWKYAAKLYAALWADEKHMCAHFADKLNAAHPPVRGGEGAEESYWWCDVCSQRVEGRQVTYHEYHDGCGGKVREVTTHSPVPPVVTEAMEFLRELGAGEFTSPFKRDPLERAQSHIAAIEARAQEITAGLALQPEPQVTTDAVASVVAERERQRTVEGWTAAHDDAHAHGELANAAASYAMTADMRPKRRSFAESLTSWPWEEAWWKPTPDNRRRELVKAGALILAEIERLDRTAALRPVDSHQSVPSDYSEPVVPVVSDAEVERMAERLFESIAGVSAYDHMSLEMRIEYIGHVRKILTASRGSEVAAAVSEAVDALTAAHAMLAYESEPIGWNVDRIEEVRDKLAALTPVPPVVSEAMSRLEDAIASGKGVALAFTKLRAALGTTDASEKEVDRGE